MIQAAVGFLLGVGLLLAGVVTKYVWMGVAGFLVMLTCAMWALTSWRHMNGSIPAPGAQAPVKMRRRGRVRGRGGRNRGTGEGFMERLEERWRRRQERDGQ